METGNMESIQENFRLLTEKIDELRILNPDNIYIKQLERAENVGSVSLLNYNELQNDKIGNIDVLSLCNTIMNRSLEISAVNAKHIEIVMSTVENYFRAKGFILDSGNKKVM